MASSKAPSPPQEAPEPETKPDALAPVKAPPEALQGAAKSVPSPLPSAAEALAGYKRPHRDAVLHAGSCGQLTVLEAPVADYLARGGALPTIRCAHCKAVRPSGEYRWQDGSAVGS